MALRRSTVADQAYELLRSWLVSGRLAPGSRLSERILSEELEVSRTPLREALSRLEADNLLRRLPSGSLEVRVLGESEISDLYACRSALEVLAVGLAIERAGPAELRELQLAVDEAGRAYVRNEPQRVVEWNTRFHAVLVEAAGNEWLANALRPLEPHFQRLRVALVSQTRQVVFVADHQAILDAIRSGDAERAERAVRSHLAGAVSRILTAPAALAAVRVGS